MKTILRLSVFEMLDRLPKWAVFASAVVLAALILYLDRMAGKNISLRLLYVPLVILCARQIRLRSAVGLSLLVAAVVFSETAFHPPGWPGSLWECFTRFALFAVLAVAISLLGHFERRARQLARSDALTGLRNSKGFRESAEAELNRSRRRGRPITVAFVDCDDFKSINDSFGHLTGDELLKTIGRTMRSNLRSYDVLARVGGDEFLLLLPETPADVARVVVERIHSHLQSAVDAHRWPVRFSIGVATFPVPPHSPADMIRAADELMYAVKRAGGGGGVKFETIRVQATEFSPPGEVSPPAS